MLVDKAYLLAIRSDAHFMWSVPGTPWARSSEQMRGGAYTCTSYLTAGIIGTYSAIEGSCNIPADASPHDDQGCPSRISVVALLSSFGCLALPPCFAQPIEHVFVVFGAEPRRTASHV